MMFPLAKMSRGIAAMTVAILIAIGVVLPSVMLLLPGGMRWWVPPLVAGLTWMAFAAVWTLWRPTGFEVSGKDLAIIWPWRRQQIRLDEITEARLIHRRELGSAIRTFGAGGLWGAFGLFWSRPMRSFNLYASRSDGLVLIRWLGRRPLVVTPADPERFIAALGVAGTDGGRP